MTRDLSQEPLLAVDNVQGDILVGLIKKVERLIFFRIDNAKEFKAFVKALDVTSMRDCLDQQTLIQTRKAAGLTNLVPTPGLNVAFTAKGLAVLGVEGLDGDTVDPAFKAGMAKRTSEIGLRMAEEHDPDVLGDELKNKSEDDHRGYDVRKRKEAEQGRCSRKVRNSQSKATSRRHRSPS